jgi:geranylgeranyl pyrophosphate synthase
MRWSLFAGGKRFRPALLLAVGNAFGVDNERLLATAAAVELIHTYSLIHDDLPSMDDDELRRGRATCHVKFGEATAILAGDALQALSFQVIADDATLEADCRVALLSRLGSAAAAMVRGQHLDLESEGKEITSGTLEDIHSNKTGALIAYSAWAGARIADASGEEREAISMYGERLGLLFQIVDDLLDVTQSTDRLGKTAGKDVGAAKATYPALYGIDRTRELADEAKRDAIDSLKGFNIESSLLARLPEYLAERHS